MTGIDLIEQDPLAVALIAFGVVLLAIAAWGLSRSPRA